MRHGSVANRTSLVLIYFKPLLYYSASQGRRRVTPSANPPALLNSHEASVFACFRDSDEFRDRRHAIRVAALKSALVPEDQLAREINAVEGLAILALDDRKSRENVADIVFAGDAVKDEVQRIE